MTSVNTNVAALNAQFNMVKNQKEMEAAMARLSSGSRLNSASDDAAGVSISERMEAHIRGLEQAIRNSEDAQNLIDTIEGAHVEIINNLQRLRELAVQSSNDTNSGIDRSFLKTEATQLLLEIDRITNQTEWNGTKVLDGNFDGKQFQVGIDQNQDIDFDVLTTGTTSMGAYVIEGTAQLLGGATAAASGIDSDFTIRGFLGNASVDPASGAMASAAATSINEKTSTTGVEAKAITNAVFQSVSNDGTVTLTIGHNGSTSSSSTVSAIVTTSDLTNLRDAINAVAGSTGVVASSLDGAAESILLTDDNGDDIVLSNYDNSGATSASAVAVAYNFDASSTSNNETFFTLAEADGNGSIDSVNINGELKLTSSERFSVDDNAGSLLGGSGDTATTFTASLSQVGSINIGTVSGSEKALDVIDGAIDYINSQRADLGAISNRLDKVMNNLSNIVENATESRSHIEDANFAAETSKLTKSQILAQAATSMLAQANASKQTVLALLQQ